MYNKAMWRLVLFFILIQGCFTLNAESSTISVGRDTNWEGISLSSRTDQVNAFLNELTQEIGFVEKMPVCILEKSSPQLFTSLNKGELKSVLSARKLNAETRATYDFSPPLLLLGPVLVVRRDDAYCSLKDLNGKKIGVETYGSSVLLVQKHPTLLIKTYENMIVALEDLKNGTIDAAVLPTLQAHAIVPQRFTYSLRIASKPLTDEAIRLFTLKGKERKLLKAFNSGLKRLKQSGIYNWLRLQYGVY